MCFSAEASFTVGALLLPAGAYCVRAAIRKGKAYLPLAIVPLVFSAQQLFEGVVWVGLAHNEPAVVEASALGFLFFAIAFWPFWLPFCIAFLPGPRQVKPALAGVAIVGLAFGIVLCVPFLLSAGWQLRVGPMHRSIRYEFSQVPAFAIVSQEWWQLLYLLIVFTPFVASRDRRFSLFCVLLVVSVAISQFVFWYAFTSVWCFFAAIISLQLCYVFRWLDEPRAQEAPAIVMGGPASAR